MNACVLLVSGAQFAVDEFAVNSKLTSNPSRYSLWRRGEVVRKGSREDSGFILDVCAVESKGLKELIEEVISFLKENFTELKQLMDHPDVEMGVLDFSINRRDVTTQYDRFPAELIRLVGNLAAGVKVVVASVEIMRPQEV